MEIISSRFLVHRCKIMIYPDVFLYFLKKWIIVNIKKLFCFLLAHFSSYFNKWLFFKFINKCQKQILRCPPSSSHACDFLFPYRGARMEAKLMEEIFPDTEVRNEIP